MTLPEMYDQFRPNLTQDIAAAAYDEGVDRSSEEAPADRKSATLRTLSLQVLVEAQKNGITVDLGEMLESLTPQLERHVMFSRKLKKWHHVEDFDAIGADTDSD